MSKVSGYCTLNMPGGRYPREKEVLEMEIKYAAGELLTGGVFYLAYSMALVSRIRLTLI